MRKKQVQDLEVGDVFFLTPSDSPGREHPLRVVSKIPKLSLCEVNWELELVCTHPAATVPKGWGPGDMEVEVITKKELAEHNRNPKGVTYTNVVMGGDGVPHITITADKLDVGDLFSRPDYGFFEDHFFRVTNVDLPNMSVWYELACRHDYHSLFPTMCTCVRVQVVTEAELTEHNRT